MTGQESTNREFSLLLLFTLAGVIAVIDRITKVACDAGLVEGQAVTVFPGFDLLLHYNTGAAFSFLSDAGGWQRWFLSVISVGVSVFLVGWLIRMPRTQKLLGVALALILGGALGNLYDRVLAGYVIDFISLYIGEYRFATFNIADSAISIGAGLMILDMFLDHKRTAAANSPDPKT